MYQYLFSEDHKFMVTASKELTKENPKFKVLPTGEYEGGILCKTCDNNILGKYETYASKTIYATDIPVSQAPIVKNYHNKEGQRWSSCVNVDYKRFKLFLLSVLWRASISTRPLFKEINLGPHQDKIKQIILNDDPGDESEYPIQMWTTAHDETIPKDFVLQPRGIKTDGHRLYIFPITGMFYLFYVSSHDKKKAILEHILKRDNTLTIFQLPVGQGRQFIAKYLKIGRK